MVSLRIIEMLLFDKVCYIIEVVITAERQRTQRVIGICMTNVQKVYSLATEVP